MRSKTLRAGGTNAKKYYAVHNGRAKGIYSDWKTCKAQVDGMKDAMWGKFGSLQQAQNFVETGVRNKSRNTKKVHSFDLAKSGFLENNQVGKSSKDSKAAKNTSGLFYAVKSNNPEVTSRVFTIWDDCHKYVYRKRGLVFKKFPTNEEAQAFISGEGLHDFDLIGISKDEFTKRCQVITDTSSIEPCCSKSVVYCDGSALGNGQQGAVAGIGVYFCDEPQLSISEPLLQGQATNNRAEIKAATRALQQIWNNLALNPQSAMHSNYNLLTDSEYVFSFLSSRYTTYKNIDELENLANSDLLIPLIKFYLCVKHYYKINKKFFANNGVFSIQWVRAHVGEEGNEVADRLARQGALAAAVLKGIDPNKFCSDEISASAQHDRGICKKLNTSFDDDSKSQVAIQKSLLQGTSSSSLPVKTTDIENIHFSPIAPDEDNPRFPDRVN